MFFLTAYRVIKFSLQNFLRNIWLSVVTITIMVMSLFVITSLVALNVVVKDTISSLQNKVDVSVYFKVSTTPDEVQTIQDNLSKLNVVTDVRRITKEEALENFKTKYEDNPVILRSLETLSSNPLGDILVIKAETLDDYLTVLSILRQDALSKYIQETDFSDFQKIIERIQSVSKKINQIGIAVSLVFIAIALLVVFNTIRVAIYTHREEIAIMRLVGATSRFIRTPYLLEGVWYALIAVIINVLFIFPVFSAVQPFMGSFFGEGTLDLLQYFKSNFFMIFGFEFLLMVVLNLVSAWIATRKYIHL